MRQAEIGKNIPLLFSALIRLLVFVLMSVLPFVMQTLGFGQAAFDHFDLLFWRGNPVL